MLTKNDLVVGKKYWMVIDALGKETVRACRMTTLVPVDTARFSNVTLTRLVDEISGKDFPLKKINDNCRFMERTHD